MKKALVVIATVVLIAGCASPEQKPVPLGSSTQISSTLIGQQFPDVVLKEYKSTQTTEAVTQVRGKVVNLWASWCEPCKREFPLMAQSAFIEKLVAINLNDLSESDAGKSQADELVALGNSSLEVWIDTDNKIKSQLGLVGLPITLAVNTQGVVVDVHVGELTDESLNRLVAAVSQ